jgi:SAM-dependent methyltransferase
MTALPICPICESAVDLIAERYPGYRAPSSFSILGCPACDLRFAHPLASDDAVYDLIYSNVRSVPGYSRYAWFAAEVLRRRNPLEFLSDYDDYWAVQRAIRDAGLSREARILEVGSGLGYLTFALARAGYAVTGLDVSQSAVATARRRYGDHFLCANLAALADSNVAPYDVIVANELIEHVVDPVALLGDMRRLLKPDGIAIVTTPNKTIAPASGIWTADAPPVHLWWFSENAMRVLGQRAALDLTLVDFTDFNRSHASSPPWSIEPAHYPEAVFDSGGRLLSRRNPIMDRLKAALRTSIVMTIAQRRRLNRSRAQARSESANLQTDSWRSQRREILGAIYRRKSELPG